MKMIRSFLPVGQGAFYCERFKLNPDEKNLINVVYDCGSSNGAKCVEKQIKANFREGEIIHAVFISHLHNDHINGLEFLLKYCNVKNIFFPLTEKVDTEISLVDSFINGTKLSKFTKAFIKSPRTAINEFYQGNEIQLFSIKPYNKDVTDIVVKKLLYTTHVILSIILLYEVYVYIVRMMPLFINVLNAVTL